MPASDRTDVDTEALPLLWAARDTGLLDALVRDVDTPAEAARQTRVTETAAAVVADVLVDLGFLTPVESGVEPTNRALGFLAKRDLRSIGPVPHALDTLDDITELPETMADGEDDGSAHAALESDDRLLNRLGSMAALGEATTRAVVTAATRTHPDADRVVCVGDGPGPFATEFAARGFDATLAEDQSVVEVVRPLLAHRPVELTTWNPGESLPDADLVFLGWPQYRPADDLRETITAAGEALRPGGRAVVATVAPDASPAGIAARTERLARGLGRLPDADVYADWFESAGLTPLEPDSVPGTERQILVGQQAHD